MINSNHRGEDRLENYIKQNGKLKLPDRFQVLKIKEDEYKLVSLHESLGFHVDSQVSRVLDLILPQLQRGCTLDEIQQSVNPQMWPVALDMLKDLADRGLVKNDASPQWWESIPQDEKETYTEQIRFFSNFRMLGEKPVPGESQGIAETNFLAQQKLKESRILIIGLGRVGSRLACGLAQAGVGYIYGSDPGRLEFGNSLDSAYSSSDAGESREMLLEKSIIKANPHVKYTPLGATSLFDKGSEALPGDLDLLVLCEEHFSPDHIETINRICLETGLVWISYRNFGHRFEIGPMVVPHETACYRCLELRRMANNPSYDDLLKTQRSMFDHNMALGALNITSGYELLAIEVIKILTNFSRPLTYSSVYTFDLASFEGKFHPVLKIPRCPVCGGPSRDRPSVRIWDLNELLD